MTICEWSLWRTDVAKSSPHIADDPTGLLGKGVDVFIVSEDIADRGLADSDLIDGLKAISRQEIPGLLAQYDQVWHW